MVEYVEEAEGDDPVPLGMAVELEEEEDGEEPVPLGMVL